MKIVSAKFFVRVYGAPIFLTKNMFCKSVYTDTIVYFYKSFWYMWVYLQVSVLYQLYITVKANGLSSP